MKQTPLALLGVVTLLALLTGFLVFLFLPNPTSQNQVQELTRMWKWQAGQDQVSGQWQKLPDYWNRKGHSGTWEYLGDFVFSAEQMRNQETFAIYIPRIGNRFAVQVNDTSIAQVGQFADDQSDHSHRVHLLQIPSIALRIGLNRIRITVQGEKLRAAGLPIVQIGPAKTLPSDRLSPLLLSPPMTLGIVILAFIMSCFFGFAFLHKRSKLDFLVSMTCISGALHLCTLLFANPKIDYHWLRFIFEASLFGFIVFLAYFNYTVLQLSTRWLNPITFLFSASALLLIPAIAFFQTYLAWQAWTTIELLYGWFIALSICYAWSKQKSKTATVLALASVLACALGTIDHFNLFFSWSGFYKAYFLRFILLVFLLALGFVMLELRAQERLQTQTKQLRAQHQHALEKQRLQQQFLQQRTALQNTIQKQERSRFMQNLHDSMGIQLQSLLVLAEKEPPNKHQLIREIQATIDQMRLTIDSLQEFNGSLSQLLGDIRYRIEARFSLFEIGLTWESDILDKTVASAQNQPNAIASSYLQQIFYELTMNVIKHASANIVRVDVQLNEKTLSIGFSDNGLGRSDSTLASPHLERNGVGTRSIRQRINELQGQVQWEAPRQGGTCCRMQFSVSKLCQAQSAQ